MSRPGMEPIQVKPGIDVYTGLLAAALVACIIGLVMLYVRSAALFPNQPLWSNG